jgi:hypothetical protein
LDSGVRVGARILGVRAPKLKQVPPLKSQKLPTLLSEKEVREQCYLVRSLDERSHVHVVAHSIGPLLEKEPELFPFSSLPHFSLRFQAAAEQFRQEVKQTAKHFVAAVDELLVLLDVVPECFVNVF